MAERAPVRDIVPKPGEELTDARITEILQGVLQNFDALFGMFPLQGSSLAGVLKLVATGSHKAAFGVTAEIASGGTAEVTHGLGAKPTSILLTPLTLAGTANEPVVPEAPTSTIFKVKNTGASAIFAYYLAIV